MTLGRVQYHAVLRTHSFTPQFRVAGSRGQAARPQPPCRRQPAADTPTRSPHVADEAGAAAHWTGAGMGLGARATDGTNVTSVTNVSGKGS